MSEMNRREFVAVSAAGLAWAVCGCAAMGQATTNSTTVDIGKPQDFPAGAMSTKFAQSDKVLVVHADDRIYAMSAVCPHRQATVSVTKDTNFRCPSHNSVFSPDGKPLSGPATDPQPRHAIALNDQGHLIVDKSKSFAEA